MGKSEHSLLCSRMDLEVGGVRKNVRDLALFLDVKRNYFAVDSWKFKIKKLEEDGRVEVDDCSITLICGEGGQGKQLVCTAQNEYELEHFGERFSVSYLSIVHYLPHHLFFFSNAFVLTTHAISLLLLS